MHRDYTPNEDHSVPTPRTVENCLDKEISAQSTRRQPKAGAVEPRQKRTRHLDLQRGTSGPPRSRPCLTLEHFEL